MPNRFDALTKQQAEKLIALASGRKATDTEPLATSVRLFYDGDHWQDGDGWVGPRPEIASSDADNGSEIDETILSLIETRFVSRNMVKEVTRRHTAGIVGREPAWTFTPVRPIEEDKEPNDAETKQINAANAVLTPWWDKRECQKLFQDATSESLFSSRAVLRVFVPSGKLVDIPAPAARQRKPALVEDTAAEEDKPTQRGVAASSLEDALDHIFVEVVIAENGAVYTDPETMEKIGIVQYKGAPKTVGGDDGPEVIELTYLEGDATVPRAERRTVVRIIGDGVNQTAAMPLGGRLLHYAIERDVLITEQFISLQKVLNLSLTMLGRGIEMNQFLERVLANTQPPGHWEMDPATGERTGRFIAGSYVTGPAATSTIQGVEVTDPQTGTINVETPSVTFRPPVELSPTIEGVREFVAECLFEAQQGHILGTDEAQSGVSREQARADFGKSLGQSEAAIEPAGRWLLEVVLWLAVAFSRGQQDIGDVSQLRALFDCFADTGPTDPATVTNLITARDKGALSTESVMEAIGVEDTDAERARINAEPGKDNAIRQAKAVSLKAFVDAGLSMPVAAKLAGFEKDEIALIAEDEAANPEPAPAQQMIPKLDGNGDPVIDPVTKQPVMIPDPNAKPPAVKAPAQQPPAARPPVAA